jgi:hypothetical protein
MAGTALVAWLAVAAPVLAQQALRQARGDGTFAQLRGPCEQ